MYMRIHCDTCGGTWEVYQRDNWKDDKARACPHCFAEIDRQTWNDYVLPAFGLTADANAELFKDSTGYHKPRFSVDFVADHLYQNRRTGADYDTANCPVADMLDQMREYIEILESAT